MNDQASCFVRRSGRNEKVTGSDPFALSLSKRERGIPWRLPERLVHPEAVPFFEPSSYLWPEFLMSRGADRKSHVSAREEQIALVITANKVDQGKAGFRVHNIVALSDDIQDRAGNILQIYRLSADLKAVLDKEIATEEALVSFAENLPSHGYVTVQPLLKQAKHFFISLALFIPI